MSIYSSGISASSATVNPALASVREDASPNRIFFALDYLDNDAAIMTDWTTEQIDHARKVLTRLAEVA